MSDASPVSVSGDAAEPVVAPVPPHLEWLKVESLDLEAQGVAHREIGRAHV